MRTSRKIGKPRKSIFDIYIYEDLKIVSKETKTPMIFILTARTVLLLLLYLAATSIFYLIGNYQGFLDSDIRLILKVLSITSTALIIFSCFGFLFAILIFVMDLHNRFRFSYILHAIIFAITFFIGFASLFGYTTINLLSGGLR